MIKSKFTPLAIFTLSIILFAGCSSSNPDAKILPNGLELGERCEAYCNDILEKYPYSTDLQACQISCEVDAQR